MSYIAYKMIKTVYAVSKFIQNSYVLFQFVIVLPMFC